MDTYTEYTKDGKAYKCGICKKLQLTEKKASVCCSACEVIIVYTDKLYFCNNCGKSHLGADTSEPCCEETEE